MKITKYNNVKNISGNKLKDLRRKNKMSQQELAEKLQLEGVDLTSKEISKIENNNRLVQDFELFAFAKIFNVSADDFNNQNNIKDTNWLVSFFLYYFFFKLVLFSFSNCFRLFLGVGKSSGIVPPSSFIVFLTFAPTL